MNTRRCLLPFTLLLAACGVARADPQPVAAEIIRAVLVVHLSDGTRCVALAPVDAGAGGFGNCAGLEWQLTADPGVNPLRRVIEQGYALFPQEDGAGLVSVSGAAGRIAFGLPG